MGNIIESPIWEDNVLQIEVGDSVGGGPSAVVNLQAQDLANRTKWLKENKFDASNFGEFYSALVSPSMTGSATLNGTTDNTVQLTAIVTTLGLEMGDVIRIQYSGYNKLHTVESITNNNLIRVNYEHAGNRGNGSLKLANTTATATITRIAKWYNAPIGLGQAWVYIKSIRSSNTLYTSITNRPMQVMVTGGSSSSLEVVADGVTLSENSGTSSRRATITFDAGYGATYKAIGTIEGWAERR